METIDAPQGDVEPTPRARRTRYQKVNDIGLTRTPITAHEAAKAAKFLFRFGRQLVDRSKPEIAGIMFTSGNRHTRMHNSRTVPSIVNPDRGWHGLVHDISHTIVHRHSAKHEWLEGKLAQHVRDAGWLEGRLRVEPKPTRPVQEVRHERVVLRIAAWERKLKRAETALRKLRAQRRYYDKKLATA
jgi:hypothetical protein